MTPEQVAASYDRIAEQWLDVSTYGFAQIERAVAFVKRKRVALDVGCGAGRCFDLLARHGLATDDVKRELDRRMEIASLITRDHLLGARRRIFDRPADLARCPEDKTELDIGPVACAETAANIICNKPQSFRGYSEHRGELQFLPHHAGTAGRPT